MLELTEEYAQKCYTFKTKCMDNHVMADQAWQYMFQDPMLIDPKQLERNRESHEHTKTGIFLIYQNIGSGKFYFRFHGDKAYFEIFIRLSNLEMTDKLDINPAQCNDDNRRFGLKKVFTIRNTVPVSRIVPPQYRIPEIPMPDIDVGKPVVSTLHLCQTCPTHPKPAQSSAPDYCPSADEIDYKIMDLDALMRMGESGIKSQQNLIREAYYKSPSQQRAPNVNEKSTHSKNAKAKKSMSTSLRSALRASGFKAETAEDSTEKPAQKEPAKSEKPKCSKSKHQGNARTIKRKTKRSGRV